MSLWKGSCGDYKELCSLENGIFGGFVSSSYLECQWLFCDYLFLVYLHELLFFLAFLFIYFRRFT